VTEREVEVIRLSIEKRQSRYAVAEALIEADWNHAVDMLIKERRDAKPETPANERSDTER
jgi:hypothetical protein